MMQQSSDQISYERWRRIAAIAWALIGIGIIAVSVLYFTFSLTSVIQPFIFAGAVVYILRPAVDFFERHGIRRIWSIFIVYLIVILIVSIVLVFIIPIIINEAQQLVRLTPIYFKNGQKLLRFYQEEIAKFRIPQQAYTIIDSVGEQIKIATIKFFSKLPGTTASVFGGLFNILLTPVIAFYFLKDMRQFRLGAINLIPDNRREEFAIILDKIDKVLGGFIRGQLTVALIVGALASIGLAILGIDFALIIGIFAGFFNLIPYMGPIVGAIPAIFLAAIKFGFLRVILVIALFAFIQTLDNILITPNVMRQNVGLPPVLVIFSLLTGGVLLGLLGMLIAIPTVAACKAIIDYLLEKRAAAQ